MRKISILGLSVAVLATTGWLAQASAQSADTSAPAASDASTPAPAPKKHHAMHRTQSAKHAPTKGDAAVEDLNAQSLDAAKSGKAFAPATTPTPAKPAKAGKPMHHHHKAAKPAADAAAPAPDASK